MLHTYTGKIQPYISIAYVVHVHVILLTDRVTCVRLVHTNVYYFNNVVYTYTTDWKGIPKKKKVTHGMYENTRITLYHV